MGRFLKSFKTEQRTPLVEENVSMTVEEFYSHYEGQVLSKDKLLELSRSSGVSLQEIADASTSPRFKSYVENIMEDETPVEEKVIMASRQTMPDTSMGRFRKIERDSMEANDARMMAPETMLHDTSVGRFRKIERDSMEANDARMMAPETMLHDTSVGRFRKIERDSMEANEAEAMQNEVPEGQSRMLPRGIHRDLDLFYGRERFRPVPPMMAGAAPMMGNRAAPMMGMPSMGMNEVEGFDRRFALPEVSSALGDTFTQRPMMQPLREPSGMLSIDGQPSRPRFIPRSRNVGER